MTNKEKIKIWLDKHEICGSQAWWDGKTYYNLSIEQIAAIAKYINNETSKKNITPWNTR